MGEGTLNYVAEVTRRLGFTRSALIIAGSKTYDLAGRVVRDLLEEKKIAVESMIVETATVRDVESVEEKIKISKPEVVFGVGGGTKIDVAKCSSAHQEVPFISIPTTASHDGIASPLSSIKGFEKPYSVMSQAPIAIIADSGLIMKEPKRFSVSGCGDVIAKLTAVKDWKLGHLRTDEYYGGYAASLALMSAKLISENSNLIREESEEGISILMEALISCGVSMSIAGSSRPCSGAEHLFSHALENIRSGDNLHGERCGVGTIMMSYLHRANWKFAKATLERLGAPTTAKELGIDNEDVIVALEMAATLRPGRYTVLNESNMSRDNCEKLARATQVIQD